MANEYINNCLIYQNEELDTEIGSFDILNRYLKDKDYTYELIEDEIDIQNIEELEYETIIETLGVSDCFQGNEVYCLKTLSKNDENLIKSNAENHKKINEIIRAIKQLDKKINNT